jgi:hypothetical protein
LVHPTQFTDLVGLVVLVVEHKKALALVFGLSVLERVVDRQGDVFTVCILRFELVDFVGLNVEDAVSAACSWLVSIRGVG